MIFTPVFTQPHTPNGEFYLHLTLLSPYRKDYPKPTPSPVGSYTLKQTETTDPIPNHHGSTSHYSKYSVLLLFGGVGGGASISTPQYIPTRARLPQCQPQRR